MSTLVVGVPSEIKDNEKRVALTPDGVVELVHHGHQVLVQAGADVGSRFPDDEYAAAAVVGRVIDPFDAPEALILGRVDVGGRLRSRPHQPLTYRAAGRAGGRS
jgi:alanine dehydrogenase